MAREPFRLFFPVGVLAGIVGVLLWPLYFGHVTEFYPGLTHPRIMTCGMFGAFIFGFLGTAMPRMLSARPFGLGDVVPLLLLHLAMLASYTASKMFIGDLFFLAALVFFLFSLAIRFPGRKDIPPPGFVLVGLSLLCVLSGNILSLLQYNREVDAFWTLLQRLLIYQGFVLLPILGIGPFLLPRFLGMPNQHDFPEGLAPTAAWFKKAGLALATGLLIIGSFVWEGSGQQRGAYITRFVATLGYFYLEMPLHRAPKVANTLGLALRLSLVALLAGFFTVPFFPAYRVSLLHLTLVGGFAVLMFVVATRVAYGHSGNIEKLKGHNRWLQISVGLMFFGMATRMSGDFWPEKMASLYVSGAVAWLIGVLLWAVYVIPKVFIPDSDV